MPLPSEEREPPVVTIVQAAAERVTTRVADDLAGQGWDYVLVSVARVVPSVAGALAAPGATARSVNRRIYPALSNEAAALRKMADQLDELAASVNARDGNVIAYAYVHDKGGW